MTNLTQKMLSLDLKAASELNHANAVSIEAKREADFRAEQRMEESQQLFEKQKNSELQQLVKSIKEDHKSATINMQQKMEAFDKDVEIDTLVEHLVSVAKDRICP